jgi:hypothetical protein
VELPTDDEAFVSGIATLVLQLRFLWDRRHSWETDEDMWILRETAFDLLSECGVHVEPLPYGSAHIGVPYTLDTLPGEPNAAELLAMASRRRA